MKEVGGAAADVGAVISYVGEQLTTIWRAAQGLLVSVENGDVPTIARQRIKHTRTSRGRHSV